MKENYSSIEIQKIFLVIRFRICQSKIRIIILIFPLAEQHRQGSQSMPLRHRLRTLEAFLGILVSEVQL